MAKEGSSGWWALHHWEPPIPPRKLTLKRSFSHVATFAPAADEEEIIISSEEEAEADMNEGNLNITENQSEVENQYEDLVVDESADEKMNLTNSVDEKMNFTNAIDANFTNVIDEKTIYVNVEKVNPLEETVVPSADLKQQLLERLLMMDSSLLQDAIKKAKAKKIAEIEGQAKKKAKAEAYEAKAAEDITAQALALPAECQAALEPFLAAFTDHLSLTPVIRASPYENDLLKKCNRVNYHENRVVARLRRKLLVRRQRRRVNLGLFDLDLFMYSYLKSTEIPLIPISQAKEFSSSSSSSSNPPVEFPITFDPQSIPYIADPSKSLYVKLTGMSALYGTCPFPITSPFTGKILPEFISEEAESLNIPKLNLLNQLKSLQNSQNPIKPSDCKNYCNSENYLTVKYTNIRKEFIGQLNDLLSDSFWPGIDVSEALEYPDYTILALVGLSVVGCAIFNPDGYLSYLYVRPDFQGQNLSAKMLALLIPLLSPRKDLTLHVSVSNTPAILLYQKIGFKPEEFIVNFYDKYLSINNRDNNSDNNSLIGNKNAFFMRLRR